MASELTHYMLRSHMLPLIGQVEASRLKPGMVVVETRRVDGADCKVHLEVGRVLRDDRVTIYTLPYTGEARTVANSVKVDVI